MNETTVALLAGLRMSKQNLKIDNFFFSTTNQAKI